MAVKEEEEMTLYIYDVDTMQMVEEIEGSTNRECEAIAEEKYYDTDVYGWTYSPAFGCYSGLKR